MAYDRNRLSLANQDVISGLTSSGKVALVAEMSDTTIDIVCLSAHRTQIDAALWDWKERGGSRFTRVTVTEIAEEDFFVMRSHLYGAEALQRSSGYEVYDCERATIGFHCPLKWDRITKTGDPTVRFCDECKRKVHFVADNIELQFRSRRGDCVAIWHEETLLMGTFISERSNV